MKIVFRIGFIFAVTIFLFNVCTLSALENETSLLINKVSKDYTKKFCNSIAFGLSNESAMNFSIQENKKVFEKRKGIKNINIELLAEEIAVSVSEDCGYLVNISGENGIKDFKQYYLSKYKELKDTN